MSSAPKVECSIFLEVSRAMTDSSDRVVKTTLMLMISASWFAVGSIVGVMGAILSDPDPKVLIGDSA